MCFTCFPFVIFMANGEALRPCSLEKAVKTLAVTFTFYTVHFSQVIDAFTLFIAAVSLPYVAITDQNSTEWTHRSLSLSLCISRSLREHSLSEPPATHLKEKKDILLLSTISALHLQYFMSVSFRDNRKRINQTRGG